MIIVVVSLLAILGLFAVIANRNFRAYPVIAVATIALVVGICVLIIFDRRRSRRRQQRHRDKWIEWLKATPPDELSTALSALWKRPSQLPSADDIRRQWQRHEPNPHSACVILFGIAGPPAQSADIRFEPEIISPTRSFGRRLYWIPVGAVLLGLWILQAIHPLPGVGRIRISGFGYIIAMAVSTTIAWVWKSGIRPTYIRLAPGVIQVMQFRYGEKKPRIRSYPMVAGTLATISGENRGRRLTLQRETQSDVLNVGQMSLTDDAQRRLWEAIFSTAPTPPLSDEELLG